MLIRKLLLLIFTAAAICANSQTNSICAEDLSQIRSILEKTPSYQSQIKDLQKERFDSLFTKLQATVASTNSNFDCYCRLWEIFDLLKDNHLGFSQVPGPYLPPAQYKDDSLVRLYRNSAAFREFPRTNINLDSLERLLKKKPLKSIEGIYYYDSFLRAGVYRTQQPNVYKAIILESRIPSWDKGQVAFMLREFAPNLYRGIYAHPVFKYFAMVKTEKYSNASLIQSHFYSSVSNEIWKKDLKAQNFTGSAAGGPNYIFKSVSDSVQYMALRSFQADDQNVAAAKSFYDSIKGKLTAKYLVLDLRNNIGGAFKTSWQFLALVRNFALKNKVYVIVNSRTFSNAEQFVVELKRNETVVILGETTNGTLAYGANYGEWEKLASGRYMVYPTDMRDTGNYLRFEEKGIEPDVFLNEKSDWIEQTLAYIKKQR